MALDRINATALLDGGVTTADIADDAVTSAKLDTNIDIAGTLDVTSTLTADGNVLVGKTSAGAASAGFESRSSGYTAITRDGSQPLEVRRLTSDGVLIDLRKDSTTVGSIGALSGNFYVVGSAKGLRFGSSSAVPATNTGSDSDNAIDLGYASSRFKDLYLSGGAYLGGTGAANYLDDYEEGSGNFTSVTDSFGNALATLANVFYYTKVGRFVQLEIRVQLSSATTGEVRLNGTPFTMSSFDTELGVVIDRNVFAASSSQIRLRAGTNNSYMYGVVTYRTS